MNILILNWRDIHNPKAGGAEVVTMEHAKGWVRRGHVVTWITSSYPHSKPEETIDGVHFKRRTNSLGIYLWGFFYAMFHGGQFDVIIDEIHAIPFLTPFATRTKKIAFIHEIAGDIWDYMAPFPLNKIGQFLEKIYLPIYRQIPFWTDANSTIEELVELGIPHKNCTAIACPISSPIPDKWKEKEAKPVFLFVSRVVAMKGIEEVIKAFGFIRKELPDSELWIVGGGEKSYIQSLKDLIDELRLTNQVVFYDRVSEEKKLLLMERAHLLLHASVKEGWGLVVLEAASRGTPSVVYNVPGLKDVVKNNKTGIVLERNSPHELAAQAVKLFHDKKRYKTYQLEGKKWVSSLTWDKVIDQSEQLLKDSIGG